MSTDVEKQAPSQLPALAQPTLLVRVMTELTEEERRLGLAYPEQNDKGKALATQNNLLVFLSNSTWASTMTSSR